MRRRVAIFVDGSNMFYAQKENKWFIDFKRLYEYFNKGDREVVDAHYFTGSPHFKEVGKVEGYRKFKSSLTIIGYHVVDKELKRSEGRERDKGNLDVEITLSMITSMNLWDEAIFLGGDGDFVPLMEYLRSHGKIVTCVGRRQSTALELINAVHRFIDLNDIRGEIEKILRGS